MKVIFMEDFLKLSSQSHQIHEKVRMGMITFPEQEHLRFDLSTLTFSEWLICGLWVEPVDILGA